MIDINNEINAESHNNSCTLAVNSGPNHLLPSNNRKKTALFRAEQPTIKP